MFLESPNGYIDPAPSQVSNLKTIPTNTAMPVLAPPPQWMRKAACIGMEELFDSLADDMRPGPRLNKAKQTCSTCPVKDLCLQMQMDAEQADGKNRFGVFGGKTPDERDEMAGRVRQRGWSDPTVCRNGLHVRTPENTHVRPNGSRLCRACQTDRQRRRDAQRRAQKD